ncbi:MAG: CotH kinase family protein [Oscillospiraceae bacterium]|nr:CotH kinase family protein [Oscillospiraceae bacterium]
MKKIKAVLAVFAALAFAGCTVIGSSNSSQSDQSSSAFIDIGTDSADSSSDSRGNSTDAVENSSSTDSNSSKPEFPEKTEPEYVEWMREEKVHEIRIKIASEEWQKIVNNPYKGDYHPADVYIDGELIENVGLRTRGHASLYMAAEVGTKFPFKIKFDKYIDDQSFMGLDELALNNGGDDYSFMRDFLGYEAFGMVGGYTSCVTFFNVYLNDELKGFYVGVEAIDTSYLERYFNSHRHNLYEGEDGASLEKNMPLSRLTQKKGSDTSKEDIKQLIRALDEAPLGEKGEIESFLDVDSALKMLAVNAVIDNRDGYCGIFAHNYYFYSSKGKLVMLPWDMNAPNMSAYTDIASPAMGVYDSSMINSRPLAKKLMAVEEYYAVYLDYCKMLTDKLPELKEKVMRVYEMIKPHVENDPNKFSTSYWFNYQYSLGNPAGTITFLTNRYTYLTERLKALEGKPIPNSALNP